MEIVAPASSANLGPGFDALGLAVDLPFRAGFDGQPAEETHPAVVAFRSWGGTGPLSFRSPIPPGRGLGFSAAARVAGLGAAAVQRGADLDDVRLDVFRRATELEGHPDNAAPSAFGGLTVSAGDRAIPVPLAIDVVVVAWVPAQGSTSTAKSRAALPQQVPFADAVFNIGRSALLLAALTTGDLGALRDATDDRLHQQQRLANVPASRAALEVLRPRTLASWLSGSGPTVAALARREEVDGLDDGLPEGRLLVLDLDHGGVRIEG
ncbi:MAG: homoserine kinase [Actinomycetota bacterium]